MSVRTSPACRALSVCVCVCVCVCVGSNSNLRIGWYFVIRFNCMCTVLRFYERTCIVLSSTFQFCIYQPPPPYTVTCDYTWWSPWSPCSVSCGDGVSFRTREIKNNQAENITLKACTLLETKPCRYVRTCPITTG